jgi:hypothetical protein
MERTPRQDQSGIRPDQMESDLPAGLAAPARRALAVAGITQLEQLAGLTEAEVKVWHGIGPIALEKLRQALNER